MVGLTWTFSRSWKVTQEGTVPSSFFRPLTPGVMFSCNPAQTASALIVLTLPDVIPFCLVGSTCADTLYCGNS